MRVHPLWYLCIIIRIILIIIVRELLKKNTKITKFVGFFILRIISLGFLYKYFLGSNDEYQFNKVFWHNTRIIHSIFYYLASISFTNNNISELTLFLISDIFFSIIYRIYVNK